jgi:hypothetical protein
MTRAFDPRTYLQLRKRKPIGDGARLESGVSCHYAALGVRLDPASASMNRLTSGEVTRLSIWSDGFDPRAVCQLRRRQVA